MQAHRPARLKSLTPIGRGFLLSDLRSRPSPSHLGFIVTAIAPLLFALGGCSAFAAGWAWKFILVTRAGYNQGFALKHTPVRGAGIAGPPVKPGWILP